MMEALRPSDSSTSSWTEALSDDNLKVRAAGSWPANILIEARITTATGPHLLAEPL